MTVREEQFISRAGGWYGGAGSGLRAVRWSVGHIAHPSAGWKGTEGSEVSGSAGGSALPAESQPGQLSLNFFILFFFPRNRNWVPNLVLC